MPEPSASSRNGTNYAVMFGAAIGFLLGAVGYALGVGWASLVIVGLALLVPAVIGARTAS